MPIETSRPRTLLLASLSAGLAMASMGCTADPAPRFRVDTGTRRDAGNGTRDTGLSADSGFVSNMDSGGGGAFDSGVPSDIGPVPDTGPAPDIGPVPDTGPVRDTGFSFPDANRDAGTRLDGGTADPITVDGLLREAFWDEAIERAPTRSGTGIWAGLNFDHFYALRTRTTLYFGFAGTFPSASSAIVIYLDVDYGSMNGVMLTSAGLTDVTTGIGSVLSNPITSIDMAFLPDFGWGAARRPESATAGSSTIGWRTLEEMGTHRLVAMGRNACTLNACETAISLSALGITPTANIAYVMRIGDTNTLRTFARDLTIPTDDPAFITGVVALTEK